MPTPARDTLLSFPRGEATSCADVTRADVANYIAKEPSLYPICPGAFRQLDFRLYRRLIAH